jgi:mono/diheme cytochrome c family protein
MRTLLLTLIGLLSLVLVACKASSPGRVETSIANEVKHKVTIGGSDWKNPVVYSADVQAEGMEHFQHHCGICHGNDGHATGVPFAQKMAPPVPDLASKDIQEYSDGQLKWIIQNGIGPSGMPGWQGILDDDEMWKIVHFIRHLPAQGSQGIPEIYKEEQEAHEHAEQQSKTHQHDESKPHTHTHQH